MHIFRTLDIYIFSKKKKTKLLDIQYTLSLCAKQNMIPNV